MSAYEELLRPVQEVLNGPDCDEVVDRLTACEIVDALFDHPRLLDALVERGKLKHVANVLDGDCDSPTFEQYVDVYHAREVPS